MRPSEFNLDERLVLVIIVVQVWTASCRRRSRTLAGEPGSLDLGGLWRSDEDADSEQDGRRR